KRKACQRRALPSREPSAFKPFGFARAVTGRGKHGLLRCALRRRNLFAARRSFAGNDGAGLHCETKAKQSSGGALALPDSRDEPRGALPVGGIVREGALEHLLLVAHALDLAEELSRAEGRRS